jgi:hypothetical protein
LVVLPVVVGVQWLLGRYNYFAQPIYFAIFLIVGVLAGIVLSSIIDQGKDSRQQVAAALHFTLWFSALISTLSALMQWLGWDTYLQPFVFPMNDLSAQARPMGNIAQPNLLSTLCCLGIVSTGWLGVKKKLTLKIVGISVLFLSFGIGLTASRMGLLFVPLLVGGSALAMKTLKESTSLRWFWLGAPLLIVFFHMTLPLVAPMLAEPGMMNQVRGLSLTSDKARLELINISINAISRNIGLGHGVGTFIEHMPFVASEQNLIGAGVGHHSHNLFLQLAFDFGVPCTLVLIVSLLVYIFRNNLYKNIDITALSAYLLIGILLIHSQLEFPLWYLHFWVVFVWAIVLLDRIGAVLIWVERFRFLLVYTLFLIFFAGIAVYVDYSESRRRYQAVFESATYQSDHAGVIRSYSLFKEQDEFIDHMFGVLTLPVTEDDLNQRRRAVQRSPAPAALIRLSVVEILAGHPDQARHHLKILRVTAPESAHLIQPHLKSACEAFRRREMCNFVE